MSLAEPAEAVGTERFDRACVLAWQTAAGTGRRPTEVNWPDGLDDVPHTLSDLVEHDQGLAFELYRAMPCYANLMYLGYGALDERFWQRVRTLLDEPDDRLADPVSYWLWCGPFESPDEVEDAWPTMLRDAGDLWLRRLLDVSGPVPWSLKTDLLHRLAGRGEWRDPVFAALESAAYDVFGAVDVPAARRLLDRLAVTGERADRLQTRLAELAGR